MATVTNDVIPYGSVIGNAAHLAGLNVIGLKRRGFSREKIRDLRSAYRLLFAQEGTFAERLEDVSESYADHELVMEIIGFIREQKNRRMRLRKPKLPMSVSRVSSNVPILNRSNQT